MTSLPVPNTKMRIEDIKLDLIDVLNTRERNEEIYKEIEKNIRTVGLKKPITVTPRTSANGNRRYLLICGEGRLRAFKALNQDTIPAQIVDVSDEDAFVMSLAENLARRHYKPLEVLASIGQLREKGYRASEIARMTGLSSTYLGGVLNLLAHGEERLLAAVESGKIPVYAAVAIFKSGNSAEDDALNRALGNALTNGELKPSEIAEVKRLAMRRKDLGKSLTRPSRKSRGGVTPSSLVKTYKLQLAKQQIMIRNAGVTEQRLLLVVGAMSMLFRDEHFTTILRAEGLDSLPDYLAQRINITR